MTTTVRLAGRIRERSERSSDSGSRDEFRFLLLTLPSASNPIALSALQRLIGSKTRFEDLGFRGRLASGGGASESQDVEPTFPPSTAVYRVACVIRRLGRDHIPWQSKFGSYVIEEMFQATIALSPVVQLSGDRSRRDNVCPKFTGLQ